MPDVPYDRETLVNALVYHQRTDTSGCHCGWAKLGASYAEHVADVYEASAAALLDRLRRVERHAREVMDYLEKYGPSIVPHLMDDDDNSGEFLRRALNGEAPR